MLSAKAALLSVIIPVYNVEPYLEQCLDSIINQTYKNLEIICINDGSTDNSLKILEKYQKKDSRIKLINQKNQGAAVARNAGLDSATGGYITFVDSDDYLELNAYEEAMKVMLNNEASLVEFGIKPFLHTNDRNVTTYIKFLESNEGMIKMLFNSVCNKIFVTEVIRNQNIRFVNIVSREDYFFNINYILLSSNKRISMRNNFYKYRQHANSVTKTKARNNEDVYHSFNYIIATAKKHNVYSKNRTYLYNEYINNVYLAKHNQIMKEINFLDKKLLNSDCPYNLKLKYIQKRNYITYTIKHPIEYECYKIFSKLCNFFDITK